MIRLTGPVAQRRPSWQLLLVALVAIGALLAGSTGAAAAAPAAGAPASRTRAGSLAAAPTSAASFTPVTAWGSPMAWGYGVAADVTVRQMARLSIGGTAVRVRVSNAFGNSPLVIGAASLGLERYHAELVPGSLRRLTFRGATGVTVPVGGLVYSDPVALTVHAGATLAVSLFAPGTELVSVHPCCTASPLSYFTPDGGGNRVDELTGYGFTYTSPWGRWLDAVDVSGRPNRGATVIFGDSISDGFHTALRWPDVLAARLRQLPAAQRVAVVDEGITANALTDVHPSDALLGGGPAGVDRLERDALSQPGITRLVLLLGTNDLWFGASAGQVIAGMQQVVALAQARGLQVIGATLLPRAGSERWTPKMELARQQVNHWMRTSGTFPVVLDLAAVVSDVYNGACNPQAMFPPYDSGDHLHPGPAGQTAMADAVPTALLGAGAAPTAPPLLAVTPTAGCPHRPAVLRSGTAVAPVQRTSTPSRSAGAGSTPAPTRSGPAATRRLAGARTIGAGGLALPVVAGILGVLLLAFLSTAGRRRRARAGRRRR